MGCKISVAPDHPNLHVRTRWGAPKPRRMVRVAGISPPVAISGFNNDIATLERAVKERVFYVKENDTFVPPPRPLPGVFNERLSGSLKRLERFLPKTAPLSRVEFVNTFRGRKLKLYTAAAEDLLRKGFSQRDAEVKVFVKYEKTDFTRKVDPVPRVISPRSARYNVEVGRFLRPLEERIFNSLKRLFDHPTVIKGMNASKSGQILHQKWSMFKRPVAIGLDASRFDQHVSIDALRWEHGVYLKCFPFGKHRRRLNHLLKMQLRNQCRGYTADGRLKYRCDGVRMSGDMNTSLGNTLIMCVMVHAYAEHKGIKIHLANNGDDCVIFMDQGGLSKFLEGMDSWFRAMGFSMVAEPPCYTFEEIEFCQTHPVWVGPDVGDYIMVRHPKWAIAKDTVCIHDYSTIPLIREWMDAVGKGGMAMAGAVPVFQDFYQTYINYGKVGKKPRSDLSWGVRTLSNKMTRCYGDVNPMTRASFYWAFGVTPDEQLILERFYSGVRLDLPFQYGGLGAIPQVAYQPLMPL